ncbi:DUF5658 family protein [Chloroflexota bacterium]
MDYNQAGEGHARWRNYYLLSGRLVTGMTANLWESVATFRRCTVEKASFILLSQFDLALTALAISLGLSELNPFIRYLADIPVLLLVVKLAIPLLIAWLIPGKLLLPSIAVLALAVLWNLKELMVFLF